jgi:hypothetical protein
MRLRRGRILAIAMVLAGGCTAKLETGYKPRLLGDSDVQRRGYYAGEFTPQAKAAEKQEQGADPELRRPGPRY